MITANKPPIFIVGAPRSGTTLLAQMLNNHQNIFVFNETLLYDAIDSALIKKNNSKHSLTDFLISRLNMRTKELPEGKSHFGCILSTKQADAAKQQLLARQQTESGNESHIKVFNEFMESMTEACEKQRWGEKTPHHLFHLDRIVKDFGHILAINVVRDPRSFLRSTKFAWRNRAADRKKDNLYHPLINSLSWRRSIRKFRKFTQANPDIPTLSLTYENLVKEPETNARKLCAFINEPFCQNMADISGSNSSFAKGGGDLEAWEIAVCEFICRREMAQYGHKKSAKGLPILSLLYSLLTLPTFIFKVAIRLRHKFGSVRTYLTMRRIIN